MEIGLLVLISAVVGGGGLGAIARAWSFHSRLYSLEDRLSLAEGILNREVKTRAAQERWKKPSKDEELVALALKEEKKPAPAFWWQKYATGAKG